MTTLLFWEKRKKRGQEISRMCLRDCSFCRVQAEAPALTGWFNRRFWNRLLTGLRTRGYRQMICGGDEMAELGKEQGLMPVPHLPLLRQLAVPLAENLYREGMTVTLYARQADNMVLQTAEGLCDRFPQVELCVGRDTECVRDFLRQKLGASPLLGECGTADRLRILLAPPQETGLYGGVNLNLTGEKGLFSGEYEDAALTGPDMEELPPAYRTDTVCVLAEKDPAYQKQIRVVRVN